MTDADVLRRAAGIMRGWADTTPNPAGAWVQLVCGYLERAAADLQPVKEK